MHKPSSNSRFIIGFTDMIANADTWEDLHLISLKILQEANQKAVSWSFGWIQKMGKKHQI